VEHVVVIQPFVDFEENFAGGGGAGDFTMWVKEASVSVRRSIVLVEAAIVVSRR